MKKAEIEIKLKDSLNEYAKEISFFANDPYSKKPATEADLVEFSKQVFYLVKRQGEIFLEHIKD